MFQIKVGEEMSGSDLLGAIVDTWDGLIYIGTSDYRIRFLNRRFIDRLGRDATGDYCFRALHDRDAPCPWCPKEVFQGESVRLRFQQPTDGRWFEGLNTPLPLADGSFAKIAYIQEISETPTVVREVPIFKLLVDCLSDAIFFHDPESSRLLYVNDMACQNLGYRREELLGMRIWEYSSQVVSLHDWQKIVRRIDTEGFVIVETRHVDREGNSKDVEIRATAVQAGLQRHIVSVARDITERKRAQARLVEERIKVEAIMAAIGDGITVQDRNYRIIYQNELQIIKQGHHLGEHCYHAYQNLDRICDGCQVAESFADGRIHRRQVVARTAHGDLHQEVTACPLADATGKVVACVEVVRDITEQKKMEQALQESNEKYRLLFSAESDAILTYDHETGEIQEANDTACRLYALSREQLAIRRWCDLGADSGNELFGERQPPLHRRGDGTFFPVEVSSGSFSWQGRTMVVAVVRDITERLRLEQSREEVFSVVSHEMRTPLTAILGFAEYLLENKAVAEQSELLQLIVKEGERMWHLIDNLLSLQRLMAGLGLEDPAPLFLPSLLQEMAESFHTPLVRQRIEIDCAADLPPVLGDAGSIQQAVRNLLGNAIKYSPTSSRIVLGARADGDRALLWVRDEGAGIPADQQEKIFERFYRVGGGKGIPGTGLGLTLVREIAQAHGGRAWVEGAPGQGSTFYMTLPFAAETGLQPA
jgi:PAS domain S-box-containing protein